MANEQSGIKAPSYLRPFERKNNLAPNANTDLAAANIRKTTGPARSRFPPVKRL
jgi:hypothetical protein